MYTKNKLFLFFQRLTQQVFGIQKFYTNRNDFVFEEVFFTIIAAIILGKKKKRKSFRKQF